MEKPEAWANLPPAAAAPPMPKDAFPAGKMHFPGSAPPMPAPPMSFPGMAEGPIGMVKDGPGNGRNRV